MARSLDCRTAGLLTRQQGIKGPVKNMIHASTISQRDFHEVQPMSMRPLPSAFRGYLLCSRSNICNDNDNLQQSDCILDMPSASGVHTQLSGTWRSFARPSAERPIM